MAEFNNGNASQAHVLVVDDSDELRAVFCRLLGRAGYQVLSARTGKECLRIVREDHPDLVLLDVVLPDMSGIEVCKQIKSDQGTSGSLVLSISGTRTSGLNTAESLDGGADAYITKPIDGQTLLAHVNALLRTKKAEQAIQELNDQLESRVSQRTVELRAANAFLKQEIADRKRVEEALKQAEEKYRGIFENAIEGIFQSSPDGRFIAANPAMARMFGYDSAEELINDRKDYF